MRWTVVLGWLTWGPLMVSCVRAELPNVVAPGAAVEKLADGFRFTEGPAPDAAGNVYFTDQPNDRILKWSVDGQLTTFLQPCGRGNGLCFDRDGSLLACADENNELWSIEMADPPKHRVVVSGHDDKRLNGPNDLWVHPQGAIYFTDPYYERPYWKRGPMEQDGQCVYRWSAARPSPSLIRVADDLKQPNGIVGTDDGKTLYVADIGAGRTYAYDIQADGGLSGKRLLCESGSDGMTLDAAGNLYLTGREGVSVYDSQGLKLGVIPIDQPWTANVCFGGADRSTLFITASEGLYAVRMRVRGSARQ